MHIRRVARRPVADGHDPRSSDSGDGGDGSEHQERGTHRPRPQQRVSGLNGHVGPFLGDRGLNSAGRFGSAIAGSNPPAAPWCWRHSLMDERPPLGRAGACHARRSSKLTNRHSTSRSVASPTCRWPRQEHARRGANVLPVKLSISPVRPGLQIPGRGPAQCARQGGGGVAKKLDGLQLLVNDAGISIDGLILRYEAEDLRRLLYVDLASTFHRCPRRRCVP